MASQQISLEFSVYQKLLSFKEKRNLKSFAEAIEMLLVEVNN